jgi:hypothetical protein
MDLKRINEEIECEFQDIFYYYNKYNYGICPTDPMMCFFLRQNEENGDVETYRLIKQLYTHLLDLCLKVYNCQKISEYIENKQSVWVIWCNLFLQY